MMLQAEAVHTALGDEGDIHPRSSFPPRAVTQLAAAAFSRAAAAAAAAAHYSAAPAEPTQSRGWRNDNAFDVVPPAVQPRSSFFVDEQPAPEPTEPPHYSAPARPVPFSHVTSSRVLAAAPPSGRAVRGLSFPTTRALLWDHSAAGDSVHLGSHEMAPVVRLAPAATLALVRLLAARTGGSAAALVRWECAPRAAADAGLVLAVEDVVDEAAVPLCASAAAANLTKAPLRVLPPPSPSSTVASAAARSASAEEAARRLLGTSVEAATLADGFRGACASNGELSLGALLPVRLAVCAAEGTVGGGGDVRGAVAGTVVLPSGTLRLTPLHPLRLCDTALSRSLKAGQKAATCGAVSTGFLTLDQARKLLPLMHSEPRTFDLPLVGVWVAGVSHPRHPAVWAAVQRYLFNANLQDKVFSKGQLLLQLYAHGAANPTCYDVLPSMAPTADALASPSAFLTYQFSAAVNNDNTNDDAAAHAARTCRAAPMQPTYTLPSPPSALSPPQKLRPRTGSTAVATVPPVEDHHHHSHRQAVKQQQQSPPPPSAMDYHAMAATPYAMPPMTAFLGVPPPGAAGQHPQPQHPLALMWPGLQMALPGPDSVIVDQQRQLSMLQQQVALLQQKLEASAAAKVSSSPSPSKALLPPPAERPSTDRETCAPTAGGGGPPPLDVGRGLRLGGDAQPWLAPPAWMQPVAAPEDAGAEAYVAYERSPAPPPAEAEAATESGGPSEGGGSPGAEFPPLMAAAAAAEKEATTGKVASKGKKGKKGKGGKGGGGGGAAWVEETPAVSSWAALVAQPPRPSTQVEAEAEAAAAAAHEIAQAAAAEGRAEVLGGVVEEEVSVQEEEAAVAEQTDAAEVVEVVAVATEARSLLASPSSSEGGFSSKADHSPPPAAPLSAAAPPLLCGAAAPLSDCSPTARSATAVATTTKGGGKAKAQLQFERMSLAEGGAGAGARARALDMDSLEVPRVVYQPLSDDDDDDSDDEQLEAICQKYLNHTSP